MCRSAMNFTLADINPEAQMCQAGTPGRKRAAADRPLLFLFGSELLLEHGNLDSLAGGTGGQFHEVHARGDPGAVVIQ